MRKTRKQNKNKTSNLCDEFKHKNNPMKAKIKDFKLKSDFTFINLSALIEV